MSGCIDNGIVVLRAAHTGSPEAVPELYATDARDGENHLRESGFHRVEERLTQTGRDTRTGTFNYSPYRVTLGGYMLQERIQL